MPTSIRVFAARGTRTDASCRVPHPRHFTSTILPASASGSMTVSCRTRQSGQVHRMSWVRGASTVRGERDRPAKKSAHRVRGRRSDFARSPASREEGGPPRSPALYRRSGTVSADIRNLPRFRREHRRFRRHAGATRHAEGGCATHHRHVQSFFPHNLRLSADHPESTSEYPHFGPSNLFVVASVARLNSNERNDWTWPGRWRHDHHRRSQFTLRTGTEQDTWMTIRGFW